MGFSGGFFYKNEKLSKNFYNIVKSMYVRFFIFFISNTFISNATLKLAKNQANAKQHPEVELLPFENYAHSSTTLSSKNNRTYSKK